MKDSEAAVAGYSPMSSSTTSDAVQRAVSMDAADMLLVLSVLLTMLVMLVMLVMLIVLIGLVVLIVLLNRGR